MRAKPGPVAAVLVGALALTASCDLVLGIPGQLDPLPGSGGNGGNGGAGGAGGGAPGGLVLRDGRLAAQPGAALTSGGSPALRVTNGAFEAAGSCGAVAGESVCVRGGLTAAGTKDP